MDSSSFALAFESSIFVGWILLFVGIVKLFKYLKKTKLPLWKEGLLFIGGIIFFAIFGLVLSLASNLNY